MQRAHRAVVARVHRLQHVQRLGAATLAHHDPVRSHAQTVAHQVANRDGTSTFDVLWLRLQADDVDLAQAKLSRVLARDDAFGGGDESGQHVQERRLARAGAAGHDDVEPRLHGRAQVFHHRRRRTTQRDDLVRAEHVASELADREAWTVDGDRWDDHVDT